jgi:hypothetical protein
MSVAPPAGFAGGLAVLIKRSILITLIGASCVKASYGSYLRRLI